MDLAKGTPGGCLFARAMSQTRVLAPAPDECRDSEAKPSARAMSQTRVLAPAPDECRDSEAKPSARAMSQTGRLHPHLTNAATAKEEHV